jgi:TolB protein
MKVQILGALLALLFFAACKDASLGPELEGRITGVVLDSETRRPVAQAVVSTSPPSSSVLTNANGEFTFVDLNEGNYTITAARNGFRTNTVTVAVRSDRTTEATVLLTEEEEEDETPGTLQAELLTWRPVVRGDSSFARIEYRATNTGARVISRYEIYFRISTSGNGPTYYSEVSGGPLQRGESDASFVETFTGSDTPSNVTIDGTFVDD